MADSPKRAKTPTAIIALTDNGCRLGARLRSLLDDSDLLLPAHRGLDVPDARRFDRGINQTIAQAFNEYQRLLLIFSAGIAVRALATCLRDKRHDPAVVVMDEKGQFAISLLSGHLGGANEFAREVAQLIGAIAVITTASDVVDTLAIDLLGHEFGWEIEEWTNVTRTSAAMVNGEPVGLYQDAGEIWCPPDKPLPQNVTLVGRLADLDRLDIAAALIITDRQLDARCSETLAKSVVYRPKSLVIGIGCNRGTSAEEIEAAAHRILTEHKLSARCVRSIATIDVKRSEDGLIEFASRWSLPIVFFAATELDAVEGITDPSEIARRWVGSRSVAEAAALLGARADQLIVPKIKLGNVTVAVARTGSHL